MVAVRDKTRGTEIMRWIFSHRNNMPGRRMKKEKQLAPQQVMARNSKVEESPLTTLQEINRYISTRLYIPWNVIILSRDENQDHSPATRVWTLNASSIEWPVDCEPGAIFDPASTSVALAIPTCVWSVLPGCGTGLAANAPKDRVHSITAAVAILLFFMMVILLFTEGSPAKISSSSIVNSIDPDHTFVRLNI